MTTKLDSAEEGTQDSQSESSNTQANQKGVQATQYVTVEQFNSLNQGIEALRRSLQSEKDKGIKKVQAEVGELREVLQSYAQGGKSIHDILGDLEAQEEREARQATLELAKMFRESRMSGSGSGGTGALQGVDVSAVLTELELDPTDTRVQEFRAKKFANETEAYREGAKLQKQILTKQPSDADKPSPEGRRQASPQGQDALMQEYNERSQKLYGHALLRLKTEMRGKGLEIS
jgi:hypothetical protein